MSCDGCKYITPYLPLRVIFVLRCAKKEFVKKVVFEGIGKKCKIVLNNKSLYMQKQYKLRF